MAELVVDGVPCEYRVSQRAPARGPVVLCVHGSGGDGVVWSYQVSRLSRQYRVIVPDLPGHGRSAGALAYTVDGYAEWLDAFRAALGFDRCVLMGHSLGGAVVQLYARMFPERVAALVLVGTGCRFVLSRQYLDQLQIPPGKEDDPQVLERARALLARLYVSDFAALAKNGIETLHADIVAAGRFDSTAWVGQLQVPALVVAGEYDLIMPRDRLRDLADRLPQSRLETVPGTGHAVMTDNPRDFNAAVKSFLDRVCHA